MRKYTLGIDFGSLSARAVVVDAANGKQMASCSCPYAHAVIEEMNGKPLGEGWALQDPADYRESMITCVKNAVAESGVAPEDIVGIGVDFTACSVLPIKQDGTPLSQVAGFEKNPHAYVKMWKHHAAQPYADRVNALARQRTEEFLKKYDGMSGEKIAQQRYNRFRSF